MNYQHLFKELQGRSIRIALTGAAGGFSRTLLVQSRAIESVTVAALCDLDLDATTALLLELGFGAGSIRQCANEDEVRRAAAEGQMVLVRDHRLLAGVAHDIVVEATGHPEVGVAIAEAALRRGVHVGMVSKETDSVAGPWLNRLALDHGVVYTTVDGDQPSNLAGLVSWARLLGFDIVAAGKSSEYDYIFHAASEEIEYCGRRYPAAGMGKLWELTPGVLAERVALIPDVPKSATPDYCEMNVVSNSTGLLPSCDALSYPLCRIDELADIFRPRAEGGILERTGVVDVFNCLRRHDEASFGGGVFVVVRCTDDTVWDLMAQKGHVVSRDRKHACIYLPYHLMGLESMVSIFSAVLHGRPSGSAEQKVHAAMLAVAERDFAAGEVLAMGGHHHDIVGMAARLVPAAEASGLAPFYLAANRRLKNAVARGAAVPIDALELDGSALHHAWLRSNEQ